MQDHRQMRDPSDGISRDLQPHVHLLSTYRFPNLQSLHPDKVAEWLLAAPKIANSEAPFYWTYLDRPAPATILLTYQAPTVGLEFPSDGYIWAPGETSFQLEVEGGTLELYHAKTGYAIGEPQATHSRRRYRLVPSHRMPPRQGAPSPNPSLWIVHYGHAEPNDRVPSNMIPMDPRTSNSISTRAYLQSQGQIVQKEFMLQDRPSWPQIAFPRNQPRGAPMYGHAPPTRVPQAMAYPPQHATAGPPAKRVRTQAAVNQAVAGSAGVAVLDIDDEEDTSRGDLFDHTTPREISVSRYKQNHEWMEEVLSSPYSMNQLLPADLGLGFRGQLAKLTEGIFDAPLDPDNDAIKNEYIGRLDPTKADEFRQRVQEHVEQSNKEIEKMKAKHAKRLAKFQRGSVVSRAEKELRNAVHEPTDVGPEYWRLEGRVDTEENEEEEVTPDTPSKVSDILDKVEAALGRRAAVVKDLVRIQDGGYEQPVAVPSPLPPPVPSPRASPPASNTGSQNSGVLVGDADIEMGGSAAGLLDQFHAGLSSHATPGSGSGFPTPQPYLQPQSAAGTPVHIPAASPQPSGNTPLQQNTQNDTNMTDVGTSNEQPVPDASGTGGDWVVVPPGGVSPTGASAPTAQAGVAPQPTAPASIIPPATTSAPITANPSPLPTASSNQTPVADFHTSPNDFADLGDLDSAGDALATYNADLGGNSNDLGDLAMDLDGGMEDSAFGEAFHGVEPRTEGDNEGNGL
ncbi:hypothetical protein HYFRA_00013380 [Hymenoscyphus fraxineus]|uniref:DUF1750-domain-containing protein n=1 Tax=Hymenoscyphus fraxineus TaxID=746836 RepID=A0A9N9LAK5_9HELO|nr:hypothetical protein HYFRA_00013380 [Hymenoscyphus fraxineus]